MSGSKLASFPSERISLYGSDVPIRIGRSDPLGPNMMVFSLGAAALKISARYVTAKIIDYYSVAV